MAITFILTIPCLISCASIERGKHAGWRYQVYDSESDLYGYINNKGLMVIKPQFDQCQEVFYGFGFVEIDEKYGFIDEWGKLVIPAQFDYADEFSDGLANVELAGKEGFINARGEFVLMLEESVSCYVFSEGLARISYGNDTWGFIDKAGKLVIGPISDKDLYGGYLFSEGLVDVIKNGKCGYMNKKGEIVIEPYWDFVRDFSGGLATVSKHIADSDKIETYVINKKGEIVVGPKIGWDAIEPFTEGLARIRIDTKCGYVNENLEIIIDPIYDWMGFGFMGGIVKVVDEERGLSGYIDKEGNWIWSKPRGRILTFMFRATTKDKITKTIELFGAVPLQGKALFLYPDIVKTSDMASPTWVYPSKDIKLLSIGLEEDQRVAYISMTVDDLEEWHRLEDVLYINATPPSTYNGFRSSAILYVYVGPNQDAEKVLHDFALYILKAHPGIVGDFYHGHAWTLEEIQEDLTWNGIHFLRPHKREQ